ncbi:polyprenyl diphosphate synthase [Intestinimonas massiliensis (ex Afouda et al. 2020)]|uniref:polyprenyl diphosphate synthase n=1 Tax=Intestinimonas massiliensis (ex Afouda et al. 2020) TaxID=1673721 RepID=UPI00102FD0EC|nr:polyprenyl diphosphate synthase [Intestinimonas massiliensis (ex Afouda et al. 2020)]
MNVLKHVAVIADGNGRWAERRGLERSAGHEQGLNKVEDMMHWCVDLRIPTLSVYCFSWENWARPKAEVDSLFAMANHYFERWPEFAENNIRVVISGTRQRVPAESLAKMDTIQRETAHCTGLTLNLCCNYSGRMEIADAVARGARTEEEITAALYQDLPEPDLIVRTGGYQRLSNFLLWQSAYAELYFTETLFPDLSLGEFKHAIKRYETTARKHGGVV